MSIHLRPDVNDDYIFSNLRDICEIPCVTAQTKQSKEEQKIDEEKVKSFHQSTIYKRIETNMIQRIIQFRNMDTFTREKLGVFFPCYL